MTGRGYVKMEENILLKTVGMPTRLNVYEIFGCQIFTSVRIFASVANLLQNQSLFINETRFG